MFTQQGGSAEGGESVSSKGNVFGIGLPQWLPADVVVGFRGHDIALGACVNLERDVLGVDSDCGVPVFAGCAFNNGNKHLVFTGTFMVELL